MVGAYFPLELFTNQSIYFIRTRASWNAPEDSSGGCVIQEDAKLGTPTTTPRYVTFADRQSQQPLQSGLSSVRRGISNFITTTVDAAFKHSTHSVAGT